MSEPERTVLISGGTRGLGAGLVEGFLRGGDRVATFGRTRTERVHEWESSPETKDRFRFEEVDATDSAACRGFVQRVAKELGPIRVLVNNAGMALEGLLPLFPDEQIDRLLDLNLKAVISLTRHVVRPMLLLDWGRVINISSIVGISGYRGLSVYGATKAALDGFTRALARELGAKAITVNSVAPGYLRTEMTGGMDPGQMDQIVRRTPLGRLGEVDDVAHLVRFLASPAAAFITGQTLVVDGGITC
jgi:3-oxoacyl-[acyl-carrier protein] reductase